MIPGKQFGRRTARAPAPHFQTDSGMAVAIPPAPALTDRIGANSLREDIARSPDLKPRFNLPPAPRLEALAFPIREHLASYFAIGSTEAAALSAASQTLYGQWTERALADKLAASLEARPPQIISQAQFAELIDRAASLPPALCYAVLKLIPERLCDNLNASGSNMEVILEKLLTTSPGKLDVKHQLIMLEHISEAFHDPVFSQHFHSQHSRTIDRPAMERVFSIFHCQLRGLVDNSGRKLALSMAADFTKGEAIPSPALLGKLQTGIEAFAVTLLARGLYMVPDGKDRADIWHGMMKSVEKISPKNVHVPLLKILIPKVAYLETQPQRENAYEKILQVIAELPANQQPVPIAHAIDQLAYVTNPVYSKDIFERLTAIARAAPLADRAALTRLIAAAVTRRPPHERMAIFAGALAQMRELPLQQQGPVLETLACAIVAHPPGHQRIEVYTTVFDAIRQIPKPFQAVPAGLLFGCLESLPPGPAQHVRFVEALDFVRSLPVESRAPMLEPLTEAIWLHANDASQLDSLDDLLSLLNAQPLAERVKCLASLYQVDLDREAESLKFALLRKLFRHVQQLPAAAQVGLIAEAAAQATRCDQPYMRLQIGAILKHSRTLSQADANDVLRKVSMALRAAACRMIYDGEDFAAVPHGFDALLEVTDILPDDLRIGLLTDLQGALVHCPQECRVAASGAIKAKLNFLPAGLLQKFLTLTRHADVPDQAGQG